MSIFKSKTILFYFLFLISILSFSCEGGKPLNNEADILSFVLKDANNTIVAEVEMVNQNIINISVSDNINISKLKPVFNLSKGAKVFPESNKYQDFTSPVDYVVMSEDGIWKQKYTIHVSSYSWAFDFEEWTSYHGVENFNPKGWNSGNIGTYTLNNILSSSNQIDYPTYRINDAYSGASAVGITTRKGGQNTMVPPIISGSLFIGNFNTKYLMSDPLRCPEFGRPFAYTGANKPVKLKAYIKYQPGLVYTDENGNIVQNKTDKCSIQAMLFYGTEPLHVGELSDNPIIIAQAYFETDEFISNYKMIEIPFVYLQDIPNDKPLQMYISAASSKDGDYYKGAVGSTLFIDDVEIVFE